MRTQLFLFLLFCILQQTVVAQTSEPYSLIDNSDKGLNTTLNNQTKKVGFTKFWALSKEDANPVIPYMYDWSNGFNRGYAIVNKAGKWGIIDTLGKVVVPIIYDEIVDFRESGLAIVSSNGKYGIVNKLGVVTVPIEYEYINPFISKVNTVSAVKNGRWGLINTSNKTIVPFTFLCSILKDDGIFIGVTDDKKTVYFLNSGTQITIPGVSEITTLAPGYYKVKTKEGTAGVVNEKQEVIIPFDKNPITSLIESEYLVTIRKDRLRGAYNLKTKSWVLEPQYTNIYPRYGGKVLYTLLKRATDDKDEVVRFFDVKGTQLFGKTFQGSRSLDAGGDEMGLFLVKYNDKWGLLNFAGKELIPYEADSDDEIRKVSGDYIVAKRSTGWGIINTNGNIIIPFQYYETSGVGNPFSFYDSEYFAVTKGEKRGIINRKGEIVIPFDYDEYKLKIDSDHPLADIEFIVAVASKGNKTNVIDLATKSLVVESNKDNIKILSSSTPDAVCPYLTGIEKKGYKPGIFLMNEKKLFVSKEYSFEYFYSERKTFIISKNEKSYGLADLSGNPVTDLGYEIISDAYEGLFFAVKNNKAGIINAFGKTIVPFEYDVERNSLGQVTNEVKFYNGYGEIKRNGKKVVVNNKGEELNTNAFKLPGDVEYFNTLFGKTFALQAYTVDKRKFFYKGKMYEDGPNLKFFGSLNYDEPKYKSALNVGFYFNYGLEALKYNGKYGFVNFDGEEVIPFQYDMVSNFTVLGYAYVKKNNEYYLIDTRGNRLPMTDLYLEVFKESSNK